MSQPVDRNHASEEALIAYALHPDAVEEAQEHHISRCEICMREVAEIISLYQGLEKKLARFDCPAEERLTAYALYELSIWQRAETKDHVWNCSYCTEEVRVIQEANEVLPPIQVWVTTRRFITSPLSSQVLNLREFE